MSLKNVSLYEKCIIKVTKPPNNELKYYFFCYKKKESDSFA